MRNIVFIGVVLLIFCGTVLAAVLVRALFNALDRLWDRFWPPKHWAPEQTEKHMFAAGRIPPRPCSGPVRRGELWSVVVSEPSLGGGWLLSMPHIYTTTDHDGGQSAAVTWPAIAAVPSAETQP